MRTGEHYRASLNDGREVVMGGELVKDVTTHEAFAGVVATVAKLYDLAAGDPDSYAFPSPDTGQPVPLCHLIPRSKEDLARRREALTRSANATFGLLGRGPDHVASFFTGFAAHPEVFARANPRFGENVVRFHKKMRDENLFVAYTIIPPQIDRSKTPGQQVEKYLAAGVCQERDDGIVIRGAQMLGTGAAIADYLFLSCIHPLKPGDEDYAMSLVVPMNAPGLRLYARPGYATGKPHVFDYPLTTRFDESDAVAVFHDVFVPWEQVFVCRNIELARAQWFETGAHILGNNQAQIRLVSKLKFWVGLARKIAATNGIDKIPSVCWDLGELASLASVVEGMVIASEATAIKKPSGVMLPNPRFLYGAMGLQAQIYPRVVQIVRELAGGGLLQVPSSVNEFLNPEMRQDFERHLPSAGSSTIERIKLMKLAWDMIGTEFAGRHQQYELFYAGAPFVAKNYSFLNYNFQESTDLVERCLAEYDHKTLAGGHPAE
jgi:4-hydroxyphenylacetate 3-monooxygenase